MNIDKAIEINKSLLDGTYDHRDEEMEEAILLGIEALKRHKHNKARTFTLLLPDETEED